MDLILNNNIEQRRLTREELENLLSTADESEKEFLNYIDREYKLCAYDFFDKYACYHNGLIIKGRPIYIVSIIKNKFGEFEFWTVVNSEINNIFSLCKYSNREIKNIIKFFNPIYATMQKINKKHLSWVEWLGFNKIHEDNLTITYKLGV